MASGNQLHPAALLQTFMERTGGNDLSCFVCTRSDLLSGDVARVFGLKAAESLFIDCIVLANVIASSATAWGEDLRPLVMAATSTPAGCLQGVVRLHKPGGVEPGSVPATAARDKVRHGRAQALAA